MTDILVFLAGFFGAFLGSVAAGSALITVPALLLLGFPVQTALGSAKLGGVGFRIGNIIKFREYKNMGVSRKEIFTFVLIAIPAAMLGTSIAVSIDTELLSKIVGVALLLLLPLIFLNKDVGVKENKAEGIKLFGAHILYFITSAWAGFFGPGSGFFGSYVRMRFYGYTIIQGKAATRLAQLLASISSVIVFAISGFIDYRAGIVMLLGMFVGGYFGAGFAIKKGDAWIKPLLGVVIVVTAIKILFFS